MQKQKTVAIATPTWGRPIITKSCLESWPMPVYAAVSPDDPDPADLPPKIQRVRVANSPLGAKFNAAVGAAFGAGFDYVCVMGSDVVAKASLWKALWDLADDGVRYAGVMDLWVVTSRYTKYWPGYLTGRRAGEPQGSARLVCREVWEEAGRELYNPGLNRGLDWSMTQKVGLPSRCLTAREHLLSTFKAPDFKSTPLPPPKNAGGRGSTDTAAFLGQHFPHLIHLIPRLV